MQTYVAICLIVFLAGFTQGLSGFGSILLSLPLLAIFLDIKTVIPLVALIGFSITIILFVQLWKHFDWKKIYPLFLGALPGIPLGVFFLKKLDKDLIQWIHGIILISYSGYNKGNASGIFFGLRRHSDFFSGPDWSHNHNSITLFSGFITPDVSWNVYGIYLLWKDTGRTLQKGDLGTPGIFGWLHDIPCGVKRIGPNLG